LILKKEKGGDHPFDTLKGAVFLHRGGGGKNQRKKKTPLPKKNQTKKKGPSPKKGGEPRPPVSEKGGEKKDPHLEKSTKWGNTFPQGKKEIIFCQHGGWKKKPNSNWKGKKQLTLIG